MHESEHDTVTESPDSAVAVDEQPATDRRPPRWIPPRRWRLTPRRTPLRPSRPAASSPSSTHAMQGAAERERERITAEVDGVTEAHVEKVRLRAAAEAEELRRLAEDDIDGIHAWTKEETIRIQRRPSGGSGAARGAPRLPRPARRDHRRRGRPDRRRRPGVSQPARRVLRSADGRGRTPRSSRVSPTRSRSRPISARSGATRAPRLLPRSPRRSTRPTRVSPMRSPAWRSPTARPVRRPRSTRRSQAPSSSPSWARRTAARVRTPSRPSWPAAMPRRPRRLTRPLTTRPPERHGRACHAAARPCRLHALDRDARGRARGDHAVDRARPGPSQPEDAARPDPSTDCAERTVPTGADAASQRPALRGQPDRTPRPPGARRVAAAGRSSSRGTTATTSGPPAGPSVAVVVFGVGAAERRLSADRVDVKSPASWRPGGGPPADPQAAVDRLDLVEPLVDVALLRIGVGGERPPVIGRDRAEPGPEGRVRRPERAAPAALGHLRDRRPQHVDRVVAVRRGVLLERGADLARSDPPAAAAAR